MAKLNLLSITGRRAGICRMWGDYCTKAVLYDSESLAGHYR